LVDRTPLKKKSCALNWWHGICAVQIFEDGKEDLKWMSLVRIRAREVPCLGYIQSYNFLMCDFSKMPCYYPEALLLTHQIDCILISHLSYLSPVRVSVH
jgi:hypothetical protein